MRISPSVVGGSRRILVSLATMLGVSVFSTVALPGTSGAEVDTPTAGFILALGGSAAVGFQPTPAAPHGQATGEGYANDVVTYEASRGVALDLTELGCPGETTASMINGYGHCYPRHDTQLGEAMEFLLEHADETGIVTIDVGFNNLRPCFARLSVNRSCVTSAIGEVRLQVATILDGLESVAGPGVTFVGLGHDDPFLADALLGPAGENFATESATAIDHLNGALDAVYTAAGASMADVDAAFGSHDLDTVRLTDNVTVPNSVVDICNLTWMCQPAPYGPNIHPNDAGYQAIAGSIEAVLKAPW
jgi:GDSL-like Lipase/Acylhydrolase family